MKSVTRLILFAFLIYFISCNDKFLAKFHQKSYKFKDFRIELVNYSKDYFNTFEIKTYKYNRTTPVVNTTFNMKIGVKDKLEEVTQFYKFLSNEYRHFPIRFEMNFAKAVKANVGGMGDLKNCGNITNGIFEKCVTYYSCNYVLDATRMPPLIPNGRFKMDVRLLYLDEEIAHVDVYFEIYTPIEYPRN